MARTKEFNEEEVLDKAVNLFWQKGYNATSAQDLVDNLGISRSSLYDTYSDKHTLFIKSLLYYRDKMASQMIALLNNSEDIEDTITQLFRLIVRDSLDTKISRGCFMVNSSVELSNCDKEVAAIVNENMKNIENAFCLAIKKGQEQGKFTTKRSARALSRFVFNTISGLQVAAKSGVDKIVFDDIISVTMSALLK